MQVVSSPFKENRIIIKLNNRRNQRSSDGESGNYNNSNVNGRMNQVNKFFARRGGFNHLSKIIEGPSFRHLDLTDIMIKLIQNQW